MNRLKCIAGFTVAGVMAVSMIALFFFGFWAIQDSWSREFPANILGVFIGIALILIIPSSFVFFGPEAKDDLVELWKNRRKA